MVEVDRDHIRQYQICRFNIDYIGSRKGEIYGMVVRMHNRSYDNEYIILGRAPTMSYFILIHPCIITNDIEYKLQSLMKSMTSVVKQTRTRLKELNRELLLDQCRERFDFPYKRAFLMEQKYRKDFVNNALLRKTRDPTMIEDYKQQREKNMQLPMIPFQINHFTIVFDISTEEKESVAFDHARLVDFIYETDLEKTVLMEQIKQKYHPSSKIVKDAFYE